ncbi:DUF1622 domain-containing protein [Flavobacterium sp. PL11]|uniref:DUF1622 domain-containing protein n=1 Tax=Flavobacterium sp. PL11 TaxID=3071717 RepID=UPI002E10DD16
MLIATDIMATIRTKPSLKSVSILGIIVIIRTFLSLSLQWSYKKNYVGKNLRKRMMSTAYPYKI